MFHKRLGRGPLAVPGEPIEALLQLFLAHLSQHSRDDMALLVNESSARNRLAHGKLGEIVGRRSIPDWKLDLVFAGKRGNLTLCLGIIE